MLIIHIATELAPIAKTGGLGDVVYSLSKELARQGHQLRIILPKYKTLSLDALDDAQIVFKKKFTFHESKPFEVVFWNASYNSLPITLIDPQPPEAVFNRDGIYGEADDAHRFLIFCFLTLEYISFCNFPASILHLHDWPTAAIALLYKHHYQQKGSKHKIVLTIHNILHQGKCPPETLSFLSFNNLSDVEDPCQPYLINLLKIGIIHSDYLTTVSPTYAKEIQTPLFGYHLDPLLRNYRDKLHGILNGIDLDYWNPYLDKALPAPYPKNSITGIFEVKRKNKEYLYNHLHLTSSKAPLFACITRLDEQKGPHLIAHGVKTILKQGGSCIILGKVVSSLTQELFDHLRQTYANHPHFHFHDQFDEGLAKLLYAAADFIIIPSLFEPCGLTQMIAMRYFTIPIVRTTGGLADTVQDLETGICFKEMSTEHFDHAIEKAFSLYQDKPLLEHLLKMMSLKDFSWKTSVKKYLELYSA